MNDTLEQLRNTLRNTWQRVTAFIERQRAPRRRAVDPSTPAPSADPGSWGSVVVTADDSVMDVVDRLEAVRSSEVVLVVPREARALRDPAAWPHIAAVAKRNLLALGVVAARGEVRSYARQNGLPAASSVRGVVRSPHHVVRLGDREFRIPRLAWGMIARGVVLVGGTWAVVLVACNTIPSAEVVIVPASEEQSASMRLRLNPISDAVDLELGIQPALSFEHTFTHTVAIVTSGEVEVADERATALLQFSNTTEAEVLVPAGTEVDEENGISFVTDADLTVPAASFGTIGATAVQPGTPGNVPLGTLVITNDLPDGVTVTNPAAASGGTDQFVPAVAEEDVERVGQIADEVLRRIGERELFAVVTDGTVFPQTISVQIFSQEPLSNPGDPAETFLIDYTAVVSALVVTEEEATRSAEALLIQQLGPGQALLPNSASATLSAARVESGTVTVNLSATGLVADLIDTEVVREAISGDSPSTARAEIQELLALERAPQIDLRPGFIPWRWLPRNADRITITYAGPSSLIEPETEDGDGESSEDGLLTTSDVAATATAEP